MDSEDSRGETAGDASSDGEASSASSSLRRASVSSVGSKNANRHSNPQSPQSVEGPESSDKERPSSHQSNQNSDIDSPENSRPPSPECPPRNRSKSGSRSPPSHPASPHTEQPSPSPSSPTPSSPNPSNSIPASPGSPTYESASDFKKKSNSGNKWSPKSDSRSRQTSLSPDNAPAYSPRNSPKKSQIKDESDSSGSSRDSSPQERTNYVNNPPTEEISEGEMEFDPEEKQSREKSKEVLRGSRRDKKDDCNVDISHEDLSDVSDLESMDPTSEDDHPSARKSFNSNRELSKIQESAKEVKSEAIVRNDKIEDSVANSSTSKLTNGNSELVKLEKIPQEKTNKTEDVEEQLDFEAEEGECLDAPPTSRSKSENNTHTQNDKKKNDDEGSGAASSLEEGEVSDDEDRRPEETEPRPVCRFYSRGQCTWGVSCRFLHPGVTDKGNYTMFDMVRTMPASGYSQHHPGHLHPHIASAALQHHSTLPMGRAEPPQAESAWERGLRTAKEMMRKACKRKEQDTDFEEKKMHLSLGGGGGHGASLGPGEEEDPDLAAYAGLPPPSSPPVVKREREEYLRVPERRSHYEDIGRGYNTRDRGYERVINRASISPPRGMLPHVYDEKLDDRGLQKSRRSRTTREVIVQRAPGGVPTGRGDEWADPWMRGGGGGGVGGGGGGGGGATGGGTGGGGGNRSPGTRRGREKQPRRRRRGYSSGSSYSSSSSSRSSSHSSNSSARSGSAGRKKRRRPHSPGKSRRAVSPSVIVQERRAATARSVAMNPPAPSARKRAASPAANRQSAANPPPPHSKNSTVDEFGRTKPTKSRQRKLYSKSSSSGSDSSSSSSESDSDSHSSSSSDSSKIRAKAARGVTASGGGVSAVPGGLDKKQPNKISSGTRLLSPKYIADAQKKEAAEGTRKDGVAPKKRPATSPIDEVLPAKKPVSRREELLKQLKAVEDAIARKRSKI